jgi:hypothetical protein
VRGRGGEERLVEEWEGRGGEGKEETEVWEERERGMYASIHGGIGGAESYAEQVARM